MTTNPQNPPSPAVPTILLRGGAIHGHPGASALLSTGGRITWIGSSDDASAHEDDADLISVGQLAERLAGREQGSDDFVLIDVREPVEFEIARIPGSVLIPLAGIKDGTALGQVPRGVPVVLHCKAGTRSAQALVSLRTAGFTDVVHLDGGMDAWAANG